MEKSYVTITARVCPVCGKQTENNELLFDRRLRNTFERTTVTSIGLCEEHQEMVDNGYVFLIELDPQKSGVFSGTERVRPEDAYRTGNYCGIRREAYDQMFSKPWEDEQPFAFCAPNLLEMLRNIPVSDEHSPE